MKEPAKAALIATGAFGLLALVVGLTTRSKSSSGSNGNNANTIPGQGIAALPAPSITRESCIECVEKHLGAALVMLSEIRAGYDYRLRVIGHLHEAEDESQAWPALHDAIRNARKTYQHTGSAPNFDTLAQLTQAVATQVVQS
jgi:hypothetical protein